MTVAETVLSKVQRLPELQQREVLAFVEHLEMQCQCQAPPWHDPYGLCADLRADLSFEEFQKNRQAMWADSNAEELRDGSCG